MIVIVYGNNDGNMCCVDGEAIEDCKGQDDDDGW